MRTPVSSSTQWGVPDWRDIAAYNVYHQRDRNAYRWEFLRRSPAYRQDWVAYKGGDTALVFAACHKFSLPTLYDPTIQTAPCFIAAEWVVPAWNADGVLRGDAAALVDRAIAEGLVLVAVDPSLSLEANIEDISKVYREYEREFAGGSLRTRINPSAYPECLRVLDARAAGALYEEIKDHLEAQPGTRDISVESLMQKHRRAISAAEKLTGVLWMANV